MLYFFIIFMCSINEENIYNIFSAFFIIFIINSKFAVRQLMGKRVLCLFIVIIVAYGHL